MKIAILSLLALAVQDPGKTLRDRLRVAYVAAADALVARQDESGAWRASVLGKADPSVAYTALVVKALLGAPRDLRAKYKAAAEKGLAWTLSRQNRDGSFGEGPDGAFLKTYTTAVALMAVSSVERTDRITDAIRGAQAYLKNHQLKEGLGAGGFAYGDLELKRDPETGELRIVQSGAANLSATSWVAEALHSSGLSLSDDCWKLILDFVRKCQNSTETNRDPELLAAYKAQGLSVGDNGNLFYTPHPERGLQKAGTVKVADRETIVGYGSMTYDGIKTYLFAGLHRDSPEVKAAVDWVRRHYSIDSHPGFQYERGKRHHLRGLFYYYLVMARTLDACGERPLVTSDGKERDWPTDLGEQFLKRIRETRMWENDSPTWYESDPVLVTSYVLNTCNILLEYLR